MVTLAWIENEIEKSLQEGNTPQNIYDLSALITVRGYLRALAEQEVEEAKPATSAPAVRISDYCADRDKVPTIDQVEQALSSVAVNTPEERERAKDCRTWAKIIRREV